MSNDNGKTTSIKLSKVPIDGSEKLRKDSIEVQSDAARKELPKRSAALTPTRMSKISESAKLFKPQTSDTKSINQYKTLGDIKDTVTSDSSATPSSNQRSVTGNDLEDVIGEVQRRVLTEKMIALKNKSHENINSEGFESLSRTSMTDDNKTISPSSSGTVSPKSTHPFRKSSSLTSIFFPVEDGTTGKLMTTNSTDKDRKTTQVVAGGLISSATAVGTSISNEVTSNEQVPQPSLTESHVNVVAMPVASEDGILSKTIDTDINIIKESTTNSKRSPIRSSSRGASMNPNFIEFSSKPPRSSTPGKGELLLIPSSIDPIPNPIEQPKRSVTPGKGDIVIVPITAEDRAKEKRSVDKIESKPSTRTSTPSKGELLIIPITEEDKKQKQEKFVINQQRASTPGKGDLIIIPMTEETDVKERVMNMNVQNRLQERNRLSTDSNVNSPNEISPNVKRGLGSKAASFRDRNSFGEVKKIGSPIELKRSNSTSKQPQLQSIKSVKGNDQTPKLSSPVSNAAISKESGNARLSLNPIEMNYSETNQSSPKSQAVLESDNITNRPMLTKTSSRIISVIPTTPKSPTGNIVAPTVKDASRLGYVSLTYKGIPANKPKVIKEANIHLEAIYPDVASPTPIEGAQLIIQTESAILSSFEIIEPSSVNKMLDVVDNNQISKPVSRPPLTKSKSFVAVESKTPLSSRNATPSRGVQSEVKSRDSNEKRLAEIQKQLRALHIENKASFEKQVAAKQISHPPLTRPKSTVVPPTKTPISSRSATPSKEIKVTDAIKQSVYEKRLEEIKRQVQAYNADEVNHAEKKSPQNKAVSHPPLTKGKYLSPRANVKPAGDSRNSTPSRIVKTAEARAPSVNRPSIKTDGIMQPTRHDKKAISESSNYDHKSPVSQPRRGASRSRPASTKPSDKNIQVRSSSNKRSPSATRPYSEPNQSPPAVNQKEIQIPMDSLEVSVIASSSEVHLLSSPVNNDKVIPADRPKSNPRPKSPGTLLKSPSMTDSAIRRSSTSNVKENRHLLQQEVLLMTESAKTGAEARAKALEESKALAKAKKEARLKALAEAAKAEKEAMEARLAAKLAYIKSLNEKVKPKTSSASKSRNSTPGKTKPPMKLKIFPTTPKVTETSTPRARRESIKPPVPRLSALSSNFKNSDKDTADLDILIDVVEQEEKAEERLVRDLLNGDSSSDSELPDSKNQKASNDAAIGIQVEDFIVAESIISRADLENKRDDRQSNVSSTPIMQGRSKSSSSLAVGILESNGDLNSVSSNSKKGEVHVMSLAQAKSFKVTKSPKLTRAPSITSLPTSLSSITTSTSLRSSNSRQSYTPKRGHAGSVDGSESLRSEEMTPEMKAKRAEALRLSKLAAKKRAEAKAKMLAEARANEKAVYESRQAARNAYSSAHTPTKIQGFFAVPVTQLLTGNFQEETVEPVEKEETKEEQQPALSPEELEMMRIESIKQTRAKALADSKAAARSRVVRRYSTPGKPNTVTPMENSENMGDIEPVPIVNETKEIVEEVKPPTPKKIVVLSAEDTAKIAEEASYAKVDTAWAFTKASEASEFSSKAREAAKESGRSTVAIVEIINSVLLNASISAEEKQFLEQENDKSSSLMRTSMEAASAASKAAAEASSSAKAADAASKAISEAESVEEAIALAEQAGQHAELASLASVRAKSSYEFAKGTLQDAKKIEDAVKSKIAQLSMSSSLSSSQLEKSIEETKKALENEERQRALEKEKVEAGLKQISLRKIEQDVSWATLDLSAIDNSAQVASDYSKLAVDASKVAEDLSQGYEDSDAVNLRVKILKASEIARQEFEQAAKALKQASSTLSLLLETSKKASEMSTTTECNDVSIQVEKLRSEMSELKAAAAASSNKAKIEQEVAISQLDELRALIDMKQSNNSEKAAILESIEGEILFAKDNLDVIMSILENMICSQHDAAKILEDSKQFSDDNNEEIRRQFEKISSAQSKLLAEYEKTQEIQLEANDLLSVLSTLLDKAANTSLFVDLEKLKHEALLNRSELTRLVLEAQNSEEEAKYVMEEVTFAYECCISMQSPDEEQQILSAKRQIREEADSAQEEYAAAQSAFTAASHSVDVAEESVKAAEVILENIHDDDVKEEVSKAFVAYDDALNHLESCRQAYERAIVLMNQISDTVEQTESMDNIASVLEAISSIQQAKSEIFAHAAVTREEEAKVKYAEEKIMLHEESARAITKEKESVGVKDVADQKSLEESRLAEADAIEAYTIFEKIRESESIANEAARAAEVFASINKQPEVVQEANNATLNAKIAAEELQRAEVSIHLAQRYAADAKNACERCLSSLDADTSIQASDDAETARINVSEQLVVVRECLENVNLAKEATVASEEAARTWGRSAVMNHDDDYEKEKASIELKHATSMKIAADRSIIEIESILTNINNDLLRLYDECEEQQELLEIMQDVRENVSQIEQILLSCRIAHSEITEIYMIIKDSGAFLMKNSDESSEVLEEFEQANIEIARQSTFCEECKRKCESLYITVHEKLKKIDNVLNVQNVETVLIFVDELDRCRERFYSSQASSQRTSDISRRCQSFIHESKALNLTIIGAIAVENVDKLSSSCKSAHQYALKADENLELMASLLNQIELMVKGNYKTNPRKEDVDAIFAKFENAADAVIDCERKIMVEEQVCTTVLQTMKGAIYANESKEQRNKLSKLNQKSVSIAIDIQRAYADIGESRRNIVTNYGLLNDWKEQQDDDKIFLEFEAVRDYYGNHLAVSSGKASSIIDDSFDTISFDNMHIIDSIESALFLSSDELLVYTLEMETNYTKLSGYLNNMKVYQKICKDLESKSSRCVDRAKNIIKGKQEAKEKRRSAHRAATKALTLARTNFEQAEGYFDNATESQKSIDETYSFVQELFATTSLRNDEKLKQSFASIQKLVNLVNKYTKIANQKLKLATDIILHIERCVDACENPKKSLEECVIESQRSNKLLSDVMASRDAVKSCQESCKKAEIEVSQLIDSMKSKLNQTEDANKKIKLLRKQATEIMMNCRESFEYVQEKKQVLEISSNNALSKSKQINEFIFIENSDVIRAEQTTASEAAAVAAYEYSKISKLLDDATKVDSTSADFMGLIMESNDFVDCSAALQKLKLNQEELIRMAAVIDESEAVILTNEKISVNAYDRAKAFADQDENDIASAQQFVEVKTSAETLRSSAIADASEIEKSSFIASNSASSCEDADNYIDGINQANPSDYLNAEKNKVAKLYNSCSQESLLLNEYVDESKRHLDDIDKAFAQLESCKIRAEMLILMETIEKSAGQIKSLKYQAKTIEMHCKEYQSEASDAVDRVSLFKNHRLSDGRISKPDSMNSRSTTPNTSGRLSTTRSRRSSANLVGLGEIKDDDEDDLTPLEEISDLHLLSVLAQSVPPISKMVDALNKLIDVFQRFICIQYAAAAFQARLERLGKILYRLISSSTNTDLTQFRSSVDNLHEILLFAIDFFQQFTTKGFLQIFLKGNEVKYHFDYYDEEIFSLLPEFVAILVGHGSFHYTINMQKYNFIIIKFDDIYRASRNNDELDSLSNLLGCDSQSLKSEVIQNINRIDDIDLDLTTSGTFTALTHPAVRLFWNVKFSAALKASLQELVDKTLEYLYEHGHYESIINRLLSISIPTETTAKPTETDMLKSYFKSAYERIDEDYDGLISVFHLNRITKHLDPTYQFYDVIQYLLIQQSCRVIPAIHRSQLNRLVWGTKDKENERMEKIITYSMMCNDTWTFIHGPKQSGKTTRYLCAAHKIARVNPNQTAYLNRSLTNIMVDSVEINVLVAWIDCTNISSYHELLSTISIQLCIHVISLNDILYEFQKFIERRLNIHSRGCVVLDHVNINDFYIYEPFFKVLKRLHKSTKKLNIVIITTEVNEPTPGHIERFQRSGKVPVSLIKFLRLESFSQGQAIQLIEKNQVGYFDSKLLIEQGSYLPGKILKLRFLKGHILRDIASVTSPTATESSDGSPRRFIWPSQERLNHLPSYRKLISGSFSRLSIETIRSQTVDGESNFSEASDTASDRYSSRSESVISNRSRQQFPDRSSSKQSFSVWSYDSRTGKMNKPQHDLSSSTLNSTAQTPPPQTAISPSTIKLDIAIADTMSRNEAICAWCLYYPLSDGIVFNKIIAWNLCSIQLEDNVDLFNYCLEQLIAKGWLRWVPNLGFVIPSSSQLPLKFVDLNNKIHESFQWELYYRYLIKELLRINDLLMSRDQLLACYRYDSLRFHFDVFFANLTSWPVLHGSLSPALVIDFVSQLTCNLSNIFDYRVLPEDGLYINKAILRILCCGDDSGMIVDNRYWNNDYVSGHIVFRACINLGWSFFTVNNYDHGLGIINNSLMHFVCDHDLLNFTYALNKKGIILRQLKRYAESLLYHEQCYKLRLQYFGEVHNETVQSMNNLAIVQYKLKNYQESITLHEKCCNIRKTMYGKHNAMYGHSNYNLATVLEEHGRYDDAMVCYEKARGAYIATYGDGHRYVKEVENKMKILTKLSMK